MAIPISPQRPVAQDLKLLILVRPRGSKGLWLLCVTTSISTHIQITCQWIHRLRFECWRSLSLLPCNRDDDKSALAKDGISVACLPGQGDLEAL